MSPSRFPILTFALVGLLLVFANDALTWGWMNLSRGPHRHVAGILAEVVNWIGPGLWLLAIALCLLLTTGSARPPWTQGHWPLAVGFFYLFHIPLMLFVPPAILGRWGFAVYLFLGSVGAVCAIWLLIGSFHVASFFLLAEPVVRSVFWGHLHHATRSMGMTLFSVASWALIGWWFRDRAARHGSQTTTVPPLSKTPAITDGCL
jgi:hypothetical protein